MDTIPNIPYREDLNEAVSTVNGSAACKAGAAMVRGSVCAPVCSVCARVNVAV